jgi:hypothetical protein
VRRVNYGVASAACAVADAVGLGPAELVGLGLLLGLGLAVLVGLGAGLGESLS